MFCKTLVFALCVVGVFSNIAEIKLDTVKTAEIKEKLRLQCEKVNAGDKVDEVADSVKAFLDCGKGLVNPDELKREIDEAKPNGALDEVFKKYCAKTPQLKTCIHTLFDGVSPCLDKSSKSYINSAKNGTDQLIDFVCYKDGDRIALFIAEQGPECFISKGNTIRECTSKLQQSTQVDNIDSVPLVDRCRSFDELSVCIVTALEGCDTPTPANMAESLFKYVRKSSPCNDALPKN